MTGTPFMKTLCGRANPKGKSLNWYVLPFKSTLQVYGHKLVVFSHRSNKIHKPGQAFDLLQ